MNEKNENPTWPNVHRWVISPWVQKMNKVLGKLGSPYELRPRFDHRRDMVSLEQIGNFELLATELLVHNVPGAFVELGCYTGSTTALLGHLLQRLAPERELHVYDTFDIDLGGEKAIYERFKETLAKSNVRLPHVHIGDVMRTVPDELPSSIAFAHIDLGIGSATFEHTRLMVHALTSTYRRLSPRGIMVFMDYHVPGQTVQGNDSNPGVRLACDAFFADKPEKINLLFGGACSHAFIRKQPLNEH